MNQLTPEMKDFLRDFAQLLDEHEIDDISIKEGWCVYNSVVGGLEITQYSRYDSDGNCIRDYAEVVLPYVDIENIRNLLNEQH